MVNKRRRKLTDKQQRFAEEYLVDLNVTQAAIRAGYTVRSAGQTGHKLMMNDQIAELIQAGRDRISTTVEVTQDAIANELRLLGFSNMLDYITIGANGDAYVDLSDLTRDQAAAIASVEVEDWIEGRNGEGRDVRKVRFKVADKRGALMELAKLLGFVKTRHEVTGKDGGPLLVGAVTETPDELRARAAQLAGATVVEDEA